MKKLLSLLLALCMLFTCTAFAGDVSDLEGEGWWDDEGIFHFYEENSDTEYEEAYDDEYADGPYLPENPMEYDENLIKISGITGIEYDRPTINYHDRVAVCSLPVTIEIVKDLKNFYIFPMYEEFGGYLLDEDAFFSQLEDGDIVFDEGYGYEIIPAKKGEVYTITEPGLYNVFAEVDYMSDWTEIVLEIAVCEAISTSAKVIVDGKEIAFEAYNINGNNYFKLRDIAYVLNGTQKTFGVAWDEASKKVNLLSCQLYHPVGGELSSGDGTNKTALKSGGGILLDGAPVDFGAYNINGNNYFKLRDLGKLFDFGISWDGVINCITIDSMANYTE